MIAVRSQERSIGWRVAAIAIFCAAVGTSRSARADDAAALKNLDEYAVYDLDAFARQFTHHFWRIENSHPVFDFQDFKGPHVGCASPERVCKYDKPLPAFALTLRDRSALEHRTTRLTVIWSAMREGWAEEAVGIEVNHHLLGVDTARITQLPPAGRRLVVEIPAWAIPDDGKLTVVIRQSRRVANARPLAAAKAKGNAGSVDWLSIDGFKIEVLP